MIKIAIGYVAIVVVCAFLILLNPMDFMGHEARDTRLSAQPVPKAQVVAQAEPAPEPALAPTAAARPADQPSGTSVAATTAAILADLNAANVADTGPVETEGDEALRKMSAAVLEGLTGARPETAAGKPTLETLVAQALADGKTDEAIDRIVNVAVAEGRITAPNGLTTTEGKVDTSVLLASILAEAKGAALGDEFGQGDLSEPSSEVPGGTLAMQAATEDVLYVVKSGDSLGALALRFYGDADLHNAIFKANRQVLDTPESLTVGMKLLIPARSGLKG